MPLYEFVAIDDYGERKTGWVEMADETALEEYLNKDGLYLLNATEKHALIGPGRGGVVYAPKGASGDVHLHKHIHQSLNLDFNLPFILGLLGLLFIIGGVFAPFVSTPFFGSISLFKDGVGDGVIVLVLACVGIWLLVIKRFLNLLIPTGLSLSLVIADVVYYVRYKYQLKQVATGDDIFDWGYRMGVDMTRLDWGLGILILGHVLVFVAVATGKKSG